MQVPSNLLLNKTGKPGKYLPICVSKHAQKWHEPLLRRMQMAIWGVISAATAGCHSFGGLLAARFFLGFVEAAYFVSPHPHNLTSSADHCGSARLSVLSQLLVYTQRVGCADDISLCRITHIWRLFWPHCRWHHRQHGRNSRPSCVAVAVHH